jgi:hypothetical protein
MMNAPDASKKATLDLGAMMEQSLDNIPEAPDFTNPPAGEYKLELKEAKIDTYTSKAEPDVEKQRLKILYAVVATVSVAGKEPPVPDGSMFTETFQATEEGLGYFKKRIKEVMNATDLAGVTLADMMASVKGQQFDARITIRLSANPAGGNYENVNIRVIPPKA